MDSDLARSPNCVIRLAAADDGPAVGKLFSEAGLSDLGVDWTRGLDGWLIVEQDGRLVGAMQVATGQPFGFIGDVVIHPSVQGRDENGNGRLGKRPGAVGFLLYATALDLLHKAGAQVVLGVTDQPALKRILEHYGAQAVGDMTLFARRL